MSLGSMFSSPGKQASQAASASDAAATPIIKELQGYTDTHQQQLRNAISGMGPNPYFSAAQQLNPQAYYLSPQDTTQFSAGGAGSGLTQGQAQSSGNPFAPPNPNIILSGGTSTGGGAGSTPPPSTSPPTNTPPIGRPPVLPPGFGGGGPRFPGPIPPREMA